MPVFTLALSLFLAAPPAQSDPPPVDRVRYQRQSTSAPRARADALQRRLEWARRNQAREAENIFAREWKQFAVCRHCIEPEMLAKQIEFMTRLIEAASKDDPEYPDYLFRLADHYLEQKAEHQRQATASQERIDAVEAELEAEAFERESARP